MFIIKLQMDNIKQTQIKPKIVVKVPEGMKKVLKVCVGGSNIEIERWLIAKYPDSALEVLLSGRHEVDAKSQYPLLDRDPRIFRKMIEFLSKY